jgi:drug/metabolite transporter (DMT)-like permease
MSAWILLALLAPAAYAGANLIDAAFARKWSKDPLGLSIASGIMNGAFLPLTLWIDPPRWPGGHWPLLAAIGILECAYLFPYYRALQEDDTSNVASLFELGKVLTPLAAFLISREIAAPTQYLGFALIVGASAALTLDVRAAGVRLRGSFGLMLLAAGCLAVQAGLYKLALDAMGWGTAFAWATALSSAFALGTLLHPRLRRRTTDALAAVRRHASPFLAGEILTFAGTAASSAAIAAATVTATKGIESLQPFFVMGLTALVGRRWPDLRNEGGARISLVRKTACFAIAAIGAGLAVGAGR